MLMTILIGNYTFPVIIQKTFPMLSTLLVLLGSKLRVRRGSEPALNLKESEPRVSCKDRRNGTRSRPRHSPDELQEVSSVILTFFFECVYKCIYLNIWCGCILVCVCACMHMCVTVYLCLHQGLFL